MQSLLDTLIPTPRLVEVSHAVLHASARTVWQHLRHEELAESFATTALFWLRTLPGAKDGGSRASIVCLDALRSTPDEPGFQLLGEEPDQSLTVGAIGKVWQLDIPFSHVASAEEYAAFSAPGWIKVAWEIRLSPTSEQSTRLELEVRVDGTDAAAWSKFERYWLLIGPGSHFIRRVLLSGLEKRFGAANAHELRPLPGDELLPTTQAQLTRNVTIQAKPTEIWPWLVQMGCRRAGFYAFDLLDNGGQPSAREIHPELARLSVGQVLPATPEGDDGFEVLRIVPERTLVLGGLYDAEAERQQPFHSECPRKYWQVTWSFVLEAGEQDTTTLWVRARARFSHSERFHAAWIRPVHGLMQDAQLRHLKQRAEGKLPRDSWRDVASGCAGAALMAFNLLTPFLRSARNHWGLSQEEANRTYDGDECIPEPGWMWTHAVNIEAPAETVWPWVAQMGADRAGFYSYQWLENLAGCELKNAEALHPQYALAVGDELVLHPEMPRLPIVRMNPGRSWVAFAAANPEDVARGRPWAAVSWAFFVEALSPDRCRVISRFRSSCSSDRETQLSLGPWLLEPIGFAMDRKALLGIRDRVERAVRSRAST